MVTVEEVSAIASSFPQVQESTSYGHRAWTVGAETSDATDGTDTTRSTDTTSSTGGTRRGSRRRSKPPTFAWIRPFSKADLKRFGDRPVPGGEILAIRAADLGEKEAILAAHPDSFFTIEHFDGFTGLLIQLDAAERDEVAEALEDAWLACAPDALAQEFLAGR